MAASLGSSAPLSSHLATLTADLAIAKEQVRSISHLSGKDITPYLTVCHMHLELLKKALKTIAMTNRTMQQRIESISDDPTRIACERECSSVQRTIKDLSTQIRDLETEVNKKDLRWQLYKVNEFLLLQADPKERLSGADIVKYFNDPENSFDIDSAFQCFLPSGSPPLTRTLSDPKTLARFIEDKAPALRDHLIDLIGPDASLVNKAGHPVPLAAYKGPASAHLEALDQGLKPYVNSFSASVSHRSLACDKARELDEDTLRSIEDTIDEVMTNRGRILSFSEEDSTYVNSSVLVELFHNRKDLQNMFYTYYLQAVARADQKITDERHQISHLSMCMSPTPEAAPSGRSFPDIPANATYIQFVHVPSLLEALRDMKEQHIVQMSRLATAVSSLKPFHVLAEEINHRAQEILRGTSSATTATAAAAAHGGGGAAAAAAASTVLTTAATASTRPIRTQVTVRFNAKKGHLELRIFESNSYTRTIPFALQEGTTDLWDLAVDLDKKVFSSIVWVLPNKKVRYEKTKPLSLDPSAEPAKEDKLTEKDFDTTEREYTANHPALASAAAASTAASEPAAAARSMLSPNFERYCRAIIDVHTSYTAASAAIVPDEQMATILGLEELKNRAEELLRATTPCDETVEAKYFDSYPLPPYMKDLIQRTLGAVGTEPHFGGGAAAAASRAAAPAAAAPTRKAVDIRFNTKMGSLELRAFEPGKPVAIHKLSHVSGTTDQWRLSLDLTKPIQYKFVWVLANRKIRYETGMNQTLNLSSEPVIRELTEADFEPAEQSYS